MANIPLMSEQDLEDNDLPTYEDTQNDKNSTNFFFANPKVVEHEAAVANAHVTIRLGTFYSFLQ